MSGHPDQAEFDQLLDALVDANVEFIVVGGVAAVLHGAPITTQDVDIVHATDEANVERLAGALQRLDARVRDVAGRDLEFDPSSLRGTGQIGLTTHAGPLDILCHLHDGRGYEELLEHSIRIEDGTLELQILDLDTLIEIKSSTGRARDQLVLPILIALARESGQTDG